MMLKYLFFSLFFDLFFQMLLLFASFNLLNLYLQFFFDFFCFDEFLMDNLLIRLFLFDCVMLLGNLFLQLMYVIRKLLIQLLKLYDLNDTLQLSMLIVPSSSAHFFSVFSTDSSYSSNVVIFTNIE